MAVIAHLRRGAALMARVYAQGVFRQRRLDGVVISVGNLTVGGTGKTPMVLWIAERLLAEGKSAGILRAGIEGGPWRPQPNLQTPGASETSSTSDEVQLLRSRLADRVMFGIGADRYKNGVALADRGVKWFILDDGFQHLQAVAKRGHRFDRCEQTFWRRAFAAGGTFARAARGVEARGFDRHHAQRPCTGDRVGCAALFKRTHLLRAHGIEFSPLALGAAPSFDRNARQSAVCFLRDRQPGAFVADLREWGFQIVGHKFFRDHHRYSPADMAEIEKEAKKAGATGVDLHGERQL